MLPGLLTRAFNTNLQLFSSALRPGFHTVRGAHYVPRPAAHSCRTLARRPPSSAFPPQRHWLANTLCGYTRSYALFSSPQRQATKQALNTRFFSSIDTRLADAALPILSPPAVGRWLLFSSTLVFAVIVVGGVTRLTESGLSITEWRPITGIVPPLSQAQWEEEFEKYKATPEFKLYVPPLSSHTHARAHASDLSTLI